MALEELRSGLSILKPESSRKLLSFPSGEDNQAAPSLDFDTKLSLRCYVPPEADENQPMECQSKGVSSQSCKEKSAMRTEKVSPKPRLFSMDLDVSSPDMLQLRLGQMSRPELDNSSFVETGNMVSQRNSKAPVFSGNKEDLSLGPKQFQDEEMKNKLHVQESSGNSGSLDSIVPLVALKLDSSQTTQSLLIPTRAGLDSQPVPAPASGNNTLPRLSAMLPPLPPGSGSELVKIHPIVDKGKRAIDGLDEKDAAATEKANMELDEYIQTTLKRGLPSPPSKMLKLTLPIPELTVGPEPGTCWMKQLKLSASDKSVSKISCIEELLPHEKKVQNVHRSEPTELVVLDEDEKKAPPEKASDQLALRPWIRRWCRPEKSKPICDPNAKLVIPDIPEKQFPSIAAMALMGKASKGIQPGEYKKKGSVTVWNDKGY